MQRGYRDSIGLRRAQLGYLSFGLTFGLACAVVAFLGILLGFDLIYIGFYTFEIAYVSTMAYAITKHELMDIRMVITRTAAYSMVGSLIVLSFIILNLNTMPQILVIITNAALALVWAMAGHRLRAFIQTPLEEKWITDWYNSDRLINDITTQLAAAFEKEHAFTSIADALKN